MVNLMQGYHDMSHGAMVDASLLAGGEQRPTSGDRQTDWFVNFLFFRGNSSHKLSSAALHSNRHFKVCLV